MAYQQVGHTRAPSGGQDTIRSDFEGVDIGVANAQDSQQFSQVNAVSPNTLNSDYTIDYNQQLSQHQQQFQQQFPQQFIYHAQQGQQYTSPYQQYQQEPQQEEQQKQQQQQQQQQPEPQPEQPFQQHDQIDQDYEQQQLQQPEKQLPDVDVTPLARWRRTSKQASNPSLKSRKSNQSDGSIFSKANSWSYETMSILLAFSSLGGIISVLAYFDGKPLPSWPSSITINAVIAILATITTASMSVPLSSGLGQLKWIRFKQGRAPLSDMEMFDDASRGAFGALGLIFKARGGFAGTFGSLVMVVALFLSPFSQQIATFPSREMRALNMTATNLRSVSYGFALHGQQDLAAFVPILPLKTSVYYGLFAENNKPWLSLDVKCDSGNCTWDPIDTLAICHKCVDMSEYMTRYCADNVTRNDDSEFNMEECGWELPSGAKLNSGAEVFSMTSLFPNGTGDASHSTIMKLVFMGTEAQDGLAGDLRPWAQQCTLSACVQTLQSSVIKGELNETIIKTVTNETVPRNADAIKNLEPVTITTPHSNGTLQTYTITREVVLAVQLWFKDLFRTGSASRNPTFINGTIQTTPGSDNVLVNLTVGISSGETFFDTDIVQAFYWNYYEYLEGIEMLMRDLAVSMTVSLRGIGGEPVEGAAFVTQTYVHVQWGFVAVPVAAVAMAAVFLLVVVWMTRSSGARLWKTSALAMLFHGLDEDARERFEDLRGFAAKMREARGVKVRLSEEGGRTSLKLDRLY